MSNQGESGTPGHSSAEAAEEESTNQVNPDVEDNTVDSMDRTITEEKKKRAED